MPIEFEEFIKIDDMEGTLKIKYNINFDIEPLEKIKVYNDEFKDIEWHDKYKEDLIKKYIFVFDTLYIKDLNKIYYNPTNLIDV